MTVLLLMTGFLEQVFGHVGTVRRVRHFSNFCSDFGEHKFIIKKGHGAEIYYSELRIRRSFYHKMLMTQQNLE